MDEKTLDFSITIDGAKREIIESGGRRFFTLLLNRSEIPQYRRRALENMRSRDFLSMRFVGEGDLLRAYYDFSGCIQLKYAYETWKKDGRDLASESIAVISAALRSLVAAEKHLFCRGDFRMNTDSIFIRPCIGDIRLAYIPEVKQGHAGHASSPLTPLIMDTVRIACDEQWSIYGEEICERIVSCNEPVSAIEKILNDKGRQICRSQWPEKSELRKDESRYDYG